jgi:hypothetical protein
MNVKGVERSSETIPPLGARNLSPFRHGGCGHCRARSAGLDNDSSRSLKIQKRRRIRSGCSMKNGVGGPMENIHCPKYRNVGMMAIRGHLFLPAGLRSSGPQDLIRPDMSFIGIQKNRIDEIHLFFKRLLLFGIAFGQGIGGTSPRQSHSM